MRLFRFLYLLTDLVSLDQAVQLIRHGPATFELIQLAWWLSRHSNLCRYLRALGDLDQALTEASTRYQRSVSFREQRMPRTYFPSVLPRR
jgi:hypothetical protein